MIDFALILNFNIPNL